MGQVWIVRSGRWAYDGSVELPVDIVALDDDDWYEIGAADGTLEDDEEPCPFGPDGVLYHVRFTTAGDRSTPTRVDSGGFARLDEAMQAAEAKAPTAIMWCSRGRRKRRRRT